MVFPPSPCSLFSISVTLKKGRFTLKKGWYGDMPSAPTPRRLMSVPYMSLEAMCMY